MDAVSSTLGALLPYLTINKPTFNITLLFDPQPANEEHRYNMPTYRGITISLQSQYDTNKITESSMFVQDRDGRNLPHPLELFEPSPGPNKTHTAQSRRCVVHADVPTFPSGQFWISYNCILPTSSPASEEVKFYYFKLVAKGQCILSWGVGEQDEWRGKTMYALFSDGTDFEGRKFIEKRGFFFPKSKIVDSNGLNGFQIQVFRAKGRKREPARYETFKELKTESCGFDLTNIGRVKKGERQRMYTYALIDAKDEPYVVFEYRFKDSVQKTPAKYLLASPISKTEDKLQTKAPNHAPRSLRGYLSIPPQRKLLPTTTRVEPSSPVKKPASSEDSRSSSETDPDEIKRRDWVIRTPSPMVPRLFDKPATPIDKPATPPAERRKAGSSGGLRSIVANALRRRDEKSASCGSERR